MYFLVDIAQTVSHTDLAMMNLKLLGRRKELGLTQVELAAKIQGVYTPDITRIEKGWIPPDDVKRALAMALETTVDAIFDVPATLTAASGQ